MIQSPRRAAAKAFCRRSIERPSRRGRLSPSEYSHSNASHYNSSSTCPTEDNSDAPVLSGGLRFCTFRCFTAKDLPVRAGIEVWIDPTTV